ncbi:hypothetical protein COO60DRAFT_1505481 [Scenedesmus sp. NREL 46B-D3]|nr:hypothetical protein COO60DRAFT_1505481 [Scenedesmus sp. NREL 46B-D3]
MRPASGLVCGIASMRCACVPWLNLCGPLRPNNKSKSLLTWRSSCSQRLSPAAWAEHGWWRVTSCSAQHVHAALLPCASTAALVRVFCQACWAACRCGMLHELAHEALHELHDHCCSIATGICFLLPAHGPESCCAMVAGWQHHCRGMGNLHCCCNHLCKGVMLDNLLEAAVPRAAAVDVASMCAVPAQGSSLLSRIGCTCNKQQHMCVARAVVL